MRSKLSFMCLIFLAVTMLGGLIITQNEATAQAPVKIGSTIPLTGSLANYGRLFKQGMDMATEDVNSSGGIKGRPFQIIIEDHKGQQDVAITVLRKLIDMDKVPVVIPSFTAIGMAQKPIAEQSKIVFFTCSITSPNFTKDSYWTFQNSIDQSVGEAMLGKAAYERFGARNVADLYENTDIGRLSKASFESAFEKAGGKTVASIGFDMGITDARAQILQALASKPDAVKVFGTGVERAIVFKQLREMGFKGRIFGADNTEQADTLNIAGAAAEGIIYWHGSTGTDSKDPLAKTFVERYTKKYNEKPDPFSMQHYEGVRMIAEVFRKGATTPEQIRTGLIGLKDFPGIGGVLNFNQERRIMRPLAFKVIKDGQFQPLK
jgi:branched-chain amino acid transport system substrate-binding protein